MNQEISIRLAREQEAFQLGQMAFRYVESALGEHNEWGWDAQRIKRSIRRRDTFVIVALCDDSIVGFAIMKYKIEEAHLMLLAVKPESRRMGVGGALVRWLEDCALEAGISTIILEVIKDNQGARRFYESMGYSKLGLLPFYYHGEVSGIRMRRELWDHTLFEK